MIKYADDTALVGRLFAKTDSLASFDHEISEFVQWCDKNHLEINTKKTKDMVFDFRRNKTHVPATVIKGESLERVTEFKYLGIEIDNQLIFDKCAKSKYKKLQQRLFFLRKLNSSHVDRTILQMFYKSALQSIITYCLVSVFGNMRAQDRGKLDRVIKQANRITGTDGSMVEGLYKSLMLNKVESILSDETHPLNVQFNRSARSNRLLQLRINTKRYANSFVPSGVRIFNEQLQR